MDYFGNSHFEPSDIDTTGTVDETQKISSYQISYPYLKLPKGKIRANIQVPSGGSVVGYGNPPMDRTTKVWDASGTLVIGSVSVTGSEDWVAGNFSVDGFAVGNAVYGVNDKTERGLLKNITARGNDHGFLLEQNGSDNIGMSGGNIVVEDCVTHDGPNGFVTKMLNVTFRRCMAYDVTVQAYVVASDNINGKNIYSRATRTRLENCRSDGCWQGTTVYSRDCFSLDNSNSVNGTQNTYIDCTHTNVGNCQVHVGFYHPVSGFTPIDNYQVTIGGGEYSYAPVFGIRFDDAARPRVTAGFFSNCPNHIVFGVNCSDPVVSDQVTYYGPVNGILSPYIVECSGLATIGVDIVRDLIVFRNTKATTIYSITTTNARKKIAFTIDDNFTSLSIYGKIYTGKGLSGHLISDGLSWAVIT
ncbi:hypothetical protein [Pseudomonas sp. PSPC3-3]|uniref:hypothetical protein n=1 Tax=unclassified Pseudomonas TaxID=196821 RepID=UPI003CE6BED9